ncbi:MAG: D-aminoacyl-tRNA deacylase [Verrucomicrobiota bacterium]|nr:D-aminoacyl-tRNA deacylase [Verrucomicrobiota bacterium]
MRVVVQRVKEASVKSDGVMTGQIGAGLLVFVGVEAADGPDDIDWMARKLPQLRIFDDTEGRMNLSIMDIGGGILVISQFTLYGNVQKGTRPSFNHAAPPQIAIPLYDSFLKALEKQMGKPIPAGVFGASMEIAALNDGPVTLFMDTKHKQL